MVVTLVEGNGSRFKQTALMLLCCVAVVVPEVLWAQSSAAAVNYQRHIQPIFDQHCIECHSGWFPQGGLRLDSLQNLREGGSNGVVLFAGEPDKGKLINLIRIVSGRFTIMPPGPTAVTQPEFDLIRSWIEQGAN